MTLPPAASLLANLLSQYRERSAPRFHALAAGLMKMVEDDLYAPLRAMATQNDLDSSGRWLDDVGQRLGVIRPSTVDAGTRFGFGARTDTVGFDQAPLGSIFGSFSSRSAVSDSVFRKVLLIRARQIIEGVSRQDMHDTAEGFIPSSGVAYDSQYRSAGFYDITGGLTAGTLAAMGSLSSDFRLFSSVGYGGWSEQASGEATIGTGKAGPAPNNALPFVYTNLAGMGADVVVAETRARFNFAGWAGTRRLRIRHCVRKIASGDINQVFVYTVQGGSLSLAATINPQSALRTSANITAGSTITDTHGNSFTCSADGGWIDLEVSIPSGADQVRLWPTFSGNAERAIMAIASIQRQVQVAAGPSIVESRDDPDGVWELVPFSVSPAGIAITDS